MKKIITLSLVLVLPLLAQGQLQNMNFEQWQADPATTINGMANKPTGWVWSNSAMENEEGMFYYPPETNAQNGTYALKLGIWYNYTKDAAKQTALINSRPTALTGYYKYTDNEILSGGNQIIKDTAQVSIHLTKWNQALSQNDTIGYGKINLNESRDYSNFTCTIIYTSNATPDKVSLFLDCSKLRRAGETQDYSGVDAVGSYFTVDNLNLVGGTMNNGHLNLTDKIKLYPNPAKNTVSISDFSGDISVYDITGKIVLTQSVAKNNSIDVQQLQKGIYTVKLIEENSIKYLKLIKD